MAGLFRTTAGACSTQRLDAHLIIFTASNGGDKLLLFHPILIPRPGGLDIRGGENNGVVPITDAEFASVMSTIANIAIEADWHTGDDNTGLDNVVRPLAELPRSPSPQLCGHVITGLLETGFPIPVDGRHARRRSRLEA